MRIGPVRRVVQTCALLLFAAPAIAAGWGLFGRYAGGDAPDPAPAQMPWWGSFSSSEVFGLELADPFAVLQVAAAAHEVPLRLLAAALPVLLFYGLVRGRVFCGWVCPANFLLEGVDALRERLGLRVRERAVPRRAKLVAAAAVLVLSALTAVPVFEAASPPGAVGKAVLFGSFAGVWTLAAVVAAELFWARRVWCRALCPLGGMYQLLGAVGAVSVTIDRDACVACGACTRRCLCDPAILQPALAGESPRVAAGDCMLCGRCVDACAEGALRIRAAAPRHPAL